MRIIFLCCRGDAGSKQGMSNSCYIRGKRRPLRLFLEVLTRFLEESVCQYVCVHIAGVVVVVCGGVMLFLFVVLERCVF